MVDPGLEQFVRTSLPRPPARVLEVGAGDGELAALLRGAGYDVVAIDPAGQGDVLAVALLDLDEPDASFDAAVAVVSLHHVEPLEPSFLRLAEVVRPGGALVVDELDVDRLDERAAAWLIEQWRAAGREPFETPRELTDGMREHVHRLATVADALEPWFELGPAARGSYLHRWHLEPGLQPAEEALIATGDLPAVGARIVGTRRGEDGSR
jgi:SAM-dependent methyltransferase